MSGRYFVSSLAGWATEMVRDMRGMRDKGRSQGDFVSSEAGVGDGNGA